MVKNMHCEGLTDPDEFDCMASRCSLVIYAPRLEDGQPSTSADVLQSDKFYSTRLSSWEGVMLDGLIQRAISVRLSTSTILLAGNFDCQLGLYSSSDQFIIGSVPHIGSQIFGLHLHRPCFQQAICHPRFSDAAVRSLVHAESEGLFQFCAAGMVSLYSNGTVPFQWTIAWSLSNHSSLSSIQSKTNWCHIIVAAELSGHLQ